jgi:hypothetical protein
VTSVAGALRLSLAVALAVAAMPPPAVAATRAPAAADRCLGHARLSLDGFPRQSLRPAFYFAAEGAGRAAFRVQRNGHDCSGEAASVRYGTRSGTAEVGADFGAVSGRATLYDPVHGRGPSTKTDWVRLKDDGVREPPVESVSVGLGNPSVGVLEYPSSAALYILDDDGARARIAFGSRRAGHVEGARLRLPVLRAGGASRAATVRYTVGPGRSPAARRGSDYDAPARGVLKFAPGQRVGSIALRIEADARAEPDENIRLALKGRRVARPRAMRLTVSDRVDLTPPRTRFHHPKHGFKYRRGDYRIREIHSFTGDGGGSGVVRTQLALRRNYKSGACAWWGGKRWRFGPCNKKRWLGMRVYERGYFYFYRLARLKPSAGTSIRSYSAFTRAWDRRGNREKRFVVGRNANTFEVVARR